jgi:hypothetical protein
MCELSLYELFLQAVGIVTIALIVVGLLMVAGGFEIDLVTPDDDKKGGKQ